MRAVVFCLSATVFPLFLLGAGCPLFPQPSPTGPEVALEVVASGLRSPVALTHAGDGSGRMFVVEQAGTIRIISASNELVASSFLDIRDRVAALSANYDERGLLGLAFHPNYAQNGLFYVYYSLRERSATRVSEFRVSDADANLADGSSERVLLEIDQPQNNHNGGQLAFGPHDGYLYVATGDGGGADDTGENHTATIGNAQDLTKLLGKILRIDVDGGDPYDIPTDNPFVNNDDARDEIYAYGLRNPYRFSFDSNDGATRLFCGDVGQGAWEEVDLITSGGNYGWFIREGAHCFDPLNSAPTGCMTGFEGEALIEPILEYAHQMDGASFGISVIGGYVYRGNALNGFFGKYVFGDFSASFFGPQGKLFVATESESGWSFDEIKVAGRESGRIDRFIFAFGVDEQQELYVLASENAGPSGTGGVVYRLVDPTD